MLSKPRSSTSARPPRRPHERHERRRPRAPHPGPRPRDRAALAEAAAPYVEAIVDAETAIAQAVAAIDRLSSAQRTAARAAEITARRLNVPCHVTSSATHTTRGLVGRAIAEKQARDGRA